ncbi:MAG TPA: chromosomal replication initiator protein DnaA [Verrucomicrobiae bacterium]|nr:chromosomal replication initiator protein DnaA [Verrucomicrobiae bacterium]
MTTGHDQLWREASKILQGMLNPELFNRWFAPIRAVEVSEDALVLGVANEFYQIWLQDNFLPLIREAVNQVSLQPLQVRLAVSQGLKPPPEMSKPSSPVLEKRVPVKADLDGKLNPRYSFESFVVGPNNNFAHAAALAVSQSPAKAYNPLFMYGGVGLGKTHLMQAIGHASSNGGKARKVCYITCEQFTNDFIQAIQNSTMTKFRKKYRQADVLLIDDIQFLGGKERMQDEFFHTFNTLFDAHKQIVLSSDRPAAEIANLENRLVSRFEWGLVTELQPPALETRIAILKKKAAMIDVKLSEQVLEFLAEKIRTNIRRLEGALVRVASYASLTGKEINRDALESLLRDALHEEAKRTITIESIQKKVAEHFDIRIADMTSRRRPQNVAFPRQVAMYLSRTLTSRSLSDIGESFGGRDHGTVLHACRLIEKRASKDQRLRQTVSYLEQALRRE